MATQLAGSEPAGLRDLERSWSEDVRQASSERWIFETGAEEGVEWNHHESVGKDRRRLPETIEGLC